MAESTSTVPADNIPTAIPTPDQLIVLCDGTGDSPEAKDRSRTNVHIMREMLGVGLKGKRALYANYQEGWEVDQFKLPNDKSRLLYYDRGLGSPVLNALGSPTELGWDPTQLFSYGHNYFTSTGAQLKAVGITENVKQAYKFLVKNYKPNDQIYLFGFSRGAYTQRLLVTMIRYIGLLDKNKFANDAELDAAIAKGFALYDENIHPDENPKVLDFKKNCYPTKNIIYFLGLWDTVRGEVKEKVRQDANLSSAVMIARHAVSIDEEREIFTPELWRASENTDSKQVWFSGVHCDVGGGYQDNRDLANIPLRWMVDEAGKFGLQVDTTSIKMFPELPLAKQHDSLNMPIGGSGAWQFTWKVLGKARRPILQNTEDESLHPSVLLRFGKTVKKGDDNLVYYPSNLTHTLFAGRNFQKQEPGLLAEIKLPATYDLDDVGEKTNLMPSPSFEKPKNKP